MSVQAIKSIDGIRFSVWSPTEIRKYSVAEITAPETYDEDQPWKLPPNSAWAGRYEHPNITYEKAIEFLEQSNSSTNAILRRDKENTDRKEKNRTRLGWIGFAVVLFCVIMALWALWEAANAHRSRYFANKSELEARRQTYLAELNKQEAKKQEFYANLSKEKAIKEKARAEMANLTAMEAARIAEARARQAKDAERTALRKEQEARLAEEQAKRAKEDAEASEAKAIKASEEAIRQKDIAIRVKGLSLAQSIAVKSTKEENEDIQGLLAKEAFDLNQANGGDAQDAFIYEAVYQALNKLEEVNKSNPDFNALDQVPDGRTRVGRIRSIKVSEDDQFIYTVGSDGLLLKWKFDVYGSKEARKSKANKPEIISSDVSVSRTLDISPDGKYLIRGGDASKLMLTDVNGQAVAQLDAHQGKRVWSLRFVPNGGGIISVGEDGTGGTAINFTNLDGNTSPLIAKTPYRLTSIDVSQEGKYVAGIGKSTEVHIWNIQNQRREFLLNDQYSDKYATAVAFSPAGRFVSVGYQDGTLMIWDLNQLASDPKYLPEKFLNHGSKISDLEFSPDGALMIVGSLDKTATIWKIRDNDYLGYGNDKEFPYLNPKYTPIKLTNHQDWVTSVAFSNDGNRAITGTANGEVKIWEIDMTLYADQICDIVRQNLSNKSWKKYVGTDDPKENDLYIETSDGRRYPLSTCGEAVQQMKDRRTSEIDE